LKEQISRTLEGRRNTAEQMLNTLQPGELGDNFPLNTFLDEGIGLQRKGPIKADAALSWVGSVAASTSSTAITKRRQRNREQLVAKIGYDWKNIYKRLTRLDTRNTGKVNVR